jgi:uncharacterized protein (TIGR02266 family)
MVDYSNIPRDSRRVPLATKVQFKFDRFSGFISEYSANISPTGMFIVSSNPEPLGRVLDLEFRLGDGFEIIQGKGEVVWSRAMADGPNRPSGMGLRFTELSEGSKDLIYRIVDRYVQEGGTPFDLTTARDRIDEPPPATSPAFSEAPAPAMAAPATAAPAMAAQTIAPGAPAGQVFSDLPPLDLEQNPFPDLGLDPVKDSSGNALPWFSAAPGEMPAAPAPRQEEDPLELFPSIGPALEEVEEAFAGDGSGRVPPREEPAAPVLSPPAPLLFPSAAPAPAGPADLFASFDPLPTTTPAVPEPAEPPASLSAPGLFADYLPKTASPSEAPPPRTLASVAGSATAHEPRRTSPLLLVIGVLALLGAGAFLLRDRIAGWLGLGGEDERIASAQIPPRPLHPHKKLIAAAPPVVQDGLTSEAAAATTDPGATAKPAAPEPAAPVQTPAASPPAVSATGAPVPEVVQRKRPPAPAPATGPALTAVDRITYEESFGGTDIVLWGNGAIRQESYVHSQMGSPPRELFRITGIRKPFPQVKIPVGTGEVKQVRIGYHEAPKGNELHIVIDLAGPQVKVTRVDQDGQRLRIHLQKG